MAVVYYFGDVAVEKDELKEKMVTGSLSGIDWQNLDRDVKIEFRGGTVRGTEITSNAALNIPDYTPMGINRPLSVEILCAYTGDAPQKFLGKKKDMLITSAVKAYNTYDAAPKAINMIKKKVEDNQYLRMGGEDDGCNIVYYSKALDVSTIHLSYNLVADTFSEETFKSISSLFKSASGLPIFAPASALLIAGSAITNAFGNIGKALLESGPFLHDSEDIRLDTPGLPISGSKQYFICNDKDKAELSEYRPGLTNDQRPSLVRRSDERPYYGNAPYILINRDGRERPDLSSFSPKLATAAILEKYYGDQSDTKVIDTIESAASLYNDFMYFQKAKKLEKDLSKMDPTSQDYIKASQILEAYRKNISNEVFLA